MFTIVTMVTTRYVDKLHAMLYKPTIPILQTFYCMEFRTNLELVKILTTLLKVSRFIILCFPSVSCYYTDYEVTQGLYSLRICVGEECRGRKHAEDKLHDPCGH